MNMPPGLQGEPSRFWAARPPLPNESRASWLQRLCGDHQYSFAVLTRVLRFRPQQFDWDRPLPTTERRRTLRMAGIERTDIPTSMDWLPVLSVESGQRSLMYRHNGAPCYRWCGACFEEDETPYLRWYWRLAHVRECWIHGVPLNQECNVCSYPFNVDKARLTGRSALSLAECPKCGCSLAAVNSKNCDYNPSEQRRLREALAPVWRGEVVEQKDLIRVVPFYVAALQSRQARRDVPRPLSEGHQALSASEVRAKARSAENMARLREIYNRERGWTLNSDSFFHQGTSPSMHRSPWHWRLSSKRRLQLAELLWRIRAELRASPLYAEKRRSV